MYSANTLVKDEFYSKVLEESIVSQKKIRDYISDPRMRELLSVSRAKPEGDDPNKPQRSMMDKTLADLISDLIRGGKDKEKEVKELRQVLKIPERQYYMMAIRGFAQANNWDDLYYFINMKKTPVGYSFLAELCIQYDKLPMAVEAIKKLSDAEEKINMLMDIGQWREAIEEAFQSKKLEYLDDIR